MDRRRATAAPLCAKRAAALALAALLAAPMGLPTSPAAAQAADGAADGAAILAPEVERREQDASNTATVAVAAPGADGPPPAHVAIEVEALELSVGRLAIEVTLDDARAEGLVEALGRIIEAAGIEPDEE